MFNYLKRLFVSIDRLDTGFRFDNRTEMEKLFDYHYDEQLPKGTVLDNPYCFQKITKSEYADENQWYIGSCVYYGVGTGLEYILFLASGSMPHISRLFNYRQRSNWPEAGSNVHEAYESYRLKGWLGYDRLPTPAYASEQYATDLIITSEMKTEALKNVQGLSLKHFWISNDSDTIARKLAQGYAVSVIIFATREEWEKENVDIITVNLKPSDAYVCHLVTLLPKSGHVEDGICRTTCVDSAWFGNKQIRHPSAEFLNKRCLGAKYWDFITDKQKPTKVYPKYNFTKPLKYGMRNEDVKQLQKVLVTEGLLSPDLTTGLFKGATFGAVVEFQERYKEKILVPFGITKGTGYVGARTLLVLNELCK